MVTIIYSNMFPLFCLVIFFFFMRRNHLFDKEQSRLFNVAIWINIISILAISLDYLLYKNLLESLDYGWMLRRVTSFINFAASPTIPLLLFLIFSKEKPNKWIYAPVIVNGILCGASMFWRIVFEITTTNGYGRGALFLLPFITSIFYIVILISHMGKFGRKSKTGERLFLCCVIIILIFCMYLEIEYSFRFLTWDATGYSLILYYLFININNTGHDPLTGVNNRALYMKRLSEIDRTMSCTYAILDINNFKRINDLRGHDAGDDHLITFTRFLEEEIKKDAEVYRIGGDEFAVLSRKWNQAEMMDHLNAACEKMKKGNIEFAYGIVEYQPNEVLDNVIQQADKNMYINKKTMKEFK